MNLSRSQTVSPLTLLDDFGRFFPKEARRPVPDEDSLKNNEAALCRFRQIKAIFLAFGIPLDPERFNEGDFIDQESPRYAPLVARLRSALPPDHQDRYGRLGLPVLFRVLRDYRHGVLSGRHAYGWFLCWPAVVGHVMNEVVKPISDEIARALAPVESLLAELICPEGRTFTMGQLIDEYGYPDVDVDAVEEEKFWAEITGEDESESPAK
jgi:hypothetical protein